MLLYLQCLTRKNRYMPRQERTKSGTGIYHVMLRGINRQDIFEDAEDYLQMVACLRMITVPWFSLEKSQASAVVAREKQVATQMLNSTVGQVNEKISNSFISNGLQEIWKDWFK